MYLHFQQCSTPEKCVILFKVATHNFPPRAFPSYCWHHCSKGNWIISVSLSCKYQQHRTKPKFIQIINLPLSRWPYAWWQNHVVNVRLTNVHTDGFINTRSLYCAISIYCVNSALKPKSCLPTGKVTVACCQTSGKSSNCSFRVRGRKLA